MNKKVTVIGGLNMDIKAKSKASLLPGDSNPSTIEISAGGVGRNIAHNLALLNVNTTLLTSIGNDMEGESVLKQTAASGVIVDKVYISSRNKTGKYIAVLDDAGEMAMAVSDMDVLEDLTVDYLKNNLKLIKSSDFIICDTNLPYDCLLYIFDISRSSGVPVCVDPVSAAKAVKLKGLLKDIYIITPNSKELEILSGLDANVESASKALIELGVSNVIATLGPKGLCHTDKNKSTCYSSIAKDIADVTGAGDSLTAGLIYGLLKYDSFQAACQCGLAAAAITLATKHTVNENISEEAIRKLLNSL
ncbi:MAG: transcriptional regulator, MarR family [Clostridia bacterium]|jgi:pseudouridine kinase|nr:transcriptional regulator, MarR family [Clostridia bacterium]